MFNCKIIITLFVFMLSTVSLMASTTSASIVIDSLPNGTDQAKLEQIEKKLTRSPHHKNPNAAGRLAVFNRNAPVATASKKETVTGPAYKNKKRVPVSADTTAAPTTARRKLTGPRYKNRRAKAHHNQ
ncbi:hypothetical protein [Neolewinella persica]|uniref:hypothetical protein n=1 Tax=Neolewinella persica TaxID=70998 RepID=UPI0003815B3D|nr:hypothetical protein [Neolewinella persica]